MPITQRSRIDSGLLFLWCCCLSCCCLAACDATPSGQGKTSTREPALTREDTPKPGSPPPKVSKPAPAPVQASSTDPAEPAPEASPGRGAFEEVALDRPLTPADLEARPLRELSLMRNTLYARRGQPFRKRWLREYFETKPWYKAGEPVGGGQLTPVEQQNAALIARVELELSRDELQKRYDAIRERSTAGQAQPNDDLELRLLSTRLGIAAPGASADEEASPLDDPARLDTQLRVEQLADLSRRDLRLVRNMIYARRGRQFKSELLTFFFENTSWYKADPEYSASKLTPLDHRNIRLVRSVEDSLGGPLSDHDHMDEEGWLSDA